MSRLRPYPVAVFPILTLLIWGNRVWLAWTQAHTSLAAKLALSIPITCFVVASVVLLVAQWRGGAERRDFRRLLQAFAAGTIVFWAIRAPMILAHHHPIAFKAVHATLAVVSIAAAVWAVRTLRARPGRDGAASSDDAPLATTRA